jgi:hypothetical protein
VKRDERLSKFRSLVEFLCSPECGGRRTSTKESEAARGRISDEFRAIGLEPAGINGFEQLVPWAQGANVLARLPGRGLHRDRAVLVAAHYDHLGWADKTRAYWGADDNAAGVAIMIDCAHALYQRPGGLDRQVIFAAFDAEEMPHFMTESMGSMYFTHRPTVPLENIDLMICMDLVGHALGPRDLSPAVRETLLVLGGEKSIGTSERLDAIGPWVQGVRPRQMSIELVPPLSDYHPFEQREVPFLFLTCGRWEHYHQVTDTPEKLDEAKCLATADYLALVVEDFANAPAPVLYDRTGSGDRATISSLHALAAGLGRSFRGSASWCTR